ncbi:MAG: hypothetical protein INH43_19120 [Acidobacteriaceae bacterium]|nr:hypothetical protein [Acidobacteriaceae bacterium]
MIHGSETVFGAGTRVRRFWSLQAVLLSTGCGPLVFRISGSYQLLSARMSVRVPRGPDAGVPVHGGDHPAIAVPTTSGTTSRPRTRSRGNAASAKYTSRAPRCAYDRIPKVARIIADLDKREQIEAKPLAEVAQCRGLDRSYWNCT